MATFPRMFWLALAALAGLAGVQALPGALDRVTPPAAPASIPAAAIDFHGTAAIELTSLTAHGASATILIRNDSEHAATASLEAVLLDRRRHQLAVASQTHELKPGRVTPVTLSLAPSSGALDPWRDDRLPAQGAVVLSAKPAGKNGAAATIKSRDLLLLQVQPSTAELLITMFGVIAAIGLAVYGSVASRHSRARPSPEGPAWTPQSWSTSLAVGGGLLTTVLGMAALPAHTHFAARSSYTALAVFYASLAALAPAVYGLLNLGGTPTPARALRLFAAAAAITVWATIGQLGTAALLFLEFTEARVISRPAGVAAAALLIVIGGLVLVAAVRAIRAYLQPAAAAGAPPPAPPGRPALL